MLLRVIVSIIVFFSIYYLLINHGYISINQNFEFNRLNFTNLTNINKKLENVNDIKKETKKFIKNNQISQEDTKGSNSIKKEEGEIKKEGDIKNEVEIKKEGEIKKEENSKLDNVYLEIKANNKSLGRIEIELYDNIVPKTTNNFRTLCKQKMYLNCPFHKLVKNNFISGGDFINRNGDGGKSIYGENFEAENFNIKHDKKGIITMICKDKKLCNSQFSILFKEDSTFDNKHVAFGCIINGLDLIRQLNVIQTDFNNVPNSACIISDCGVFQKNSVKNENSIVSLQ
jgi:cyclophilin family peptidyl-prolyl cis-trans isomerase